MVPNPQDISDPDIILTYLVDLFQGSFTEQELQAYLGRGEGGSLLDMTMALSQMDAGEREVREETKVERERDVCVCVCT